MAIIIRNLICCLLAVTTSFCAFAEEAKPKEFDLRFTVFAGSSIADLGFVQHPPKGPPVTTSVTFYPMSRSPQYRYRGPMPLEFIDTTNKNVVATVTIPDEMTTPLFIFTAKAASAGESKYQVLIIDDSLVAHRPQGLAILNLSGLALEGSVNRRPVTLRAGLNDVISVGGSTSVQFRTEFRGKSYLAFSDTVSVGSGAASVSS